RYSHDVLREAIRNTKNGGPLDLRVANGRSFVTFKLDYHDGENYPVLHRNGQAPLLDDIMKPVTRWLYRRSPLPRVLLVFAADGLHQFRVRIEPRFDSGAPGPRVRFGIVDRDADIHM